MTQSPPSHSPSPSPLPTTTAKSVPLTCSGHTRPVVHLEYSDLQDDGTYTLLSSCKDGNPMLRDWLGDWVGTFQGHKGAVWSGRLSGGEASRAVTGSADFSAKVWDTFSGDCLHTFAHNHIVRAVAIDAGGSRILTGGHEKKLRLFDLAKPDADAVEFGSPSSPAHDGNIKSILWSRTDENVVLTAAEDKKVKWWDVRSGKTAHEMQFDAPIASMEKSPSTGMPNLVTLASGNRAIFLDAANRTIAKEFTLPHPPSSVSLHPTTSSRFIAGALNDGWIRIHDYNTGEQLELHKGHHGPAHVVAYSPDGELAASGSEDGTIRLWQTYPGKKYGLWA